jgi:hypothetical protein
MIDIRYPNITGKTDKEKIEQLHRYLIYLADLLNYALPQLEINNAQSNNTDMNRRDNNGN